MRTLAYVLGFIATVTANVVPIGSSLKLNDVYYFISPFSQGRAYDGPLPLDVGTQSAFGFIPVSIVTHGDGDGDGDLQGLFSNWTTKDDVWQSGFLDTIFVGSDVVSQTTKTGSFVPNVRSSILPLSRGFNVASGPYFLDIASGEVHQAFRLYDDFAGAFSQSLLQTPQGTFQTLSAMVPSSASLTIGVPSRLYSNPTKEKPLSGARIGVKDIYDLAGVKKSNGNRAWYSHYPPSNTTGTAIQRLIDAGAVIVGLQKPSQFANGEVATADWVDYHEPFNPRGDGYQDTSSSSAGAGASIASYEWLDIAVGSDTGGSIRGPSGNQGLFGNRPSHGLVSLDNVMPLSPRLDTAGFLLRDPYLLDAANRAMYEDNYTSFADEKPAYPETLYTLDFPTTNTSEARTLKKFASQLAAFLNTTITPLNLEDEWKRAGLVDSTGGNITQYLNVTYNTLITKDQTRLVRDPFYSDYAASHDGRLPFIDPVVESRWSWADAQPTNALTNEIHKKTTFMNWFNTKILPRSPNPLTCTSGILLHTESTGSFVPRNQYRSPPSVPVGFGNSQISVFSGAPDSVFPIGQVASFSPITNHTEFLPVTVDVVVAKDCDGLVAKLAQDLVEAGIIEVPKVGSGLDGGEILFKRGTVS